MSHDTTPARAKHDDRNGHPNDLTAFTDRRLMIPEDCLPAIRAAFADTVRICEEALRGERRIFPGDAARTGGAA